MKRSLMGIVGGVALSAAMLTSVAIGKDIYKMGSLAPGTDWFTVNTAFTKVVNKYVDDVDIKVEATGPVTRHGLLVAQDKMDFSGWAAIVHRLLQQGAGPFKKIEGGKELSQNLGMLYAFPVGFNHIVTYADSGIESLQDIAGKKVFIGPPGSGLQRNNGIIIEAQTGLKPDVDYETIKMGFAAAQTAFMDRKFDVYMPQLGNPPVSQIEQLALTNKIRLLGLDPALDSSEGMQKLLKEPNFVTQTYDPTVYGGNVVNTEPVHTTYVIVGNIARMSLDEDLVYRMVKAFWENIDEARAVAPKLEDMFTLENAMSLVVGRLHPGAKRYYDEIGVTPAVVYDPVVE